MHQAQLTCLTHHVGGGWQVLDDNAAVGTCLASLVANEPRAETLERVRAWYRSMGWCSYCVAVGVAAGYGVRLVEQAVAYLARQMRAEAVKFRLEHLELLCSISRMSLV